PTGIDRESQCQRKRGGDPGSEKRNEPEQRRQHAPKEGVGDADKIKPDADRKAISGIHHKLHYQITGDPSGRVVNGLGGDIQLSATDEPDEPLAEVLALKEHEDDD